MAYSLASIYAAIYSSILVLFKAACSAARSASALDRRRALSLTTCSFLISASTLDLLSAAYVAALDKARSASILDLLKAFSASNYERYLGLRIAYL